MRRYKLIGLLLVIPLLALAGISIYWSPKPVVNIYDRVPTTENSNKYRVEVNGASVPVELYPTTTGNVGFARFALVDPAKITVSVREPITHYVLSPKAYNIAVSVSGNKMSFTLDNPQYLVLHQLNGLREELFLLADAPETNPPQLGTPGVTNALDQKGIDNQNRADSAAGLTAALASISKAGGGTLYVPPGVYKIQHSILLPSNVNLYLAPGSVLQVDPKYPCCFHDQGVIDIEDANDVKLTGRGIINGNVVNIPPGKQDFHLIVTENVQRLQIDGVTLLDQGDAALRLVDVHNGMVQNVKMLASRPHAGADGIDFDSSDNILVDNAFIYSSDDSTSQGAGTGLRHTIKDNFNLTVQNSVLYQAQTGAAFKIGTTDPQKSIHDIVYNNINIVSCVQMAAFYPTFGANIENVLLQDVRAELVTDRPLEFHAVIPSWSSDWNGKIGFIHGINLTNIVVDATGARHSDFLGYSSNQDINDVRFTNFRQNGALVLDLASARIDTNRFASNIVFQQQ